MRLSARAKILIAVAVTSALLVGVAVALALVWRDAGWLLVDVAHGSPTEGSRIHVRFPGAIVPVALACIPDREFACGDDADARRWLPVARSVCCELARYPDAVLVEVESPREIVRIAKDGRHLVVRVEGNEERVHVRVPLRTAETVLAKLARANGV